MPEHKLSDVRWFLNRSRHIAYMAFLIDRPISSNDADEIVRLLLGAFPRLAWAADLAKSEHFELVPEQAQPQLNVLPPQNIDSALAHLVADLSAPFVPGLKPNLSVTLVNSPDGRQSLLFFSAPHAAIEGMDTSRKLRALPRLPGRFGLTRAAKWAMVFVALPVSVVQLIVAPVMAKPRHLFTRRILTFDRKALRAAAKRRNLQWQALLLAIIISSTGSSRSRYLRLPRLVAIAEVPTKTGDIADDLKLRMRFSLQWPSGDPHEDALACQRHMSKTGSEGNFPFKLTTAGLAVHRWLATRFSFLYPERSFQFFPGSLSFSIMPPYRVHQFGALGSAALVVAGSNTPGVQSCIVTLSSSSVALSLNLLGDGAEQLDAIRTRIEELGVAVKVLV